MAEKERFIDNQDGTITDSKTELMWMREDAWQKEAKWYTWDEAVEFASYMNNIKFAGFQNWRLPNEEEIQSLYHSEACNKDKYGKEMNLFEAFPSGGLSTVWLKGESGHEGTLFDFKNGEFRPLYKSKSGRMTVRLVRGEILK